MTISGPSPRARVATLRPAAWYQFGVGITSSASKVSQWSDQTSNVRHLLQATANNKPTLQSDGSILFDGSNFFLQTATFTLVQPSTLYMLWRQVTWNSGGVCCDGFTAASGQIVQTTGTPQINISAGSSTAANTGLAVNTYAATAAVFNGASSSLQVNKKPATTGSAGTTAMAGLTIGADGSGGNPANVQVKEVILFNAAHNLQQQFQVINYLSNIGGLGL